MTRNTMALSYVLAFNISMNYCKFTVADHSQQKFVSTLELGESLCLLQVSKKDNNNDMNCASFTFCWTQGPINSSSESCT